MQRPSLKRLSRPVMTSNARDIPPPVLFNNNNHNHNENQESETSKYIDKRVMTSTDSSTNFSLNEVQMQTIFLNLMSKITELSSKLNTLLNRVDEIESCFPSNHSAESEQVATASSDDCNDFLKLNRLFESLSARMTVCETDILLIKQSQLKSKMNASNRSSSNERTLDANDSASYETPFQSFLQPPSSTSPRENYEFDAASKGAGIIQGIPFSVQHLAESLNDLSISSNESTPRVDETVKVSKLKEDMVRAQDLVMRAKQLSEDLQAKNF